MINLSSYIKDQVHYLEARVYYENTDAGGVVYHSDYLNFAERGRTELLRACGIHQSELAEQKNCLFVVSELSIIYKKPLKLDDLIVIKTQIKNFGLARLNLIQTILAGSNICAQMDVTVVCLNEKNWAPQRFSKEIQAFIKEGLHG